MNFVGYEYKKERKGGDNIGTGVDGDDVDGDDGDGDDSE